MKVKQISVFLENKSGRLSTLTRTLADNKINIRALSIADTTDFGILRLIVDKPEDAYHSLKKAGFTVSETEVIAVEIPDTPGGLADVMDKLASAGINIEYLYAFVTKTVDHAHVIFRVEQLDKAIETLLKAGIGVVKGEQLYTL